MDEYEEPNGMNKDMAMELDGYLERAAIAYPDTFTSIRSVYWFLDDIFVRNPGIVKEIRGFNEKETYRFMECMMHARIKYDGEESTDFISSIAGFRQILRRDFP